MGIEDEFFGDLCEILARIDEQGRRNAQKLGDFLRQVPESRLSRMTIDDVLLEVTGYTPATHKHRCDGCLLIWEHSEASKENEEAHMCPGCGKGPMWFRFYG